MSTQTPNPVILLAFANDRDGRVSRNYLFKLPGEARRLPPRPRRVRRQTAVA
jgi:hypothetical protein